MRPLALALLLAAIALAQTSTSSISGTVTDPSGGVVPGANVTLTNEGTGIANVQKTTAAGVYSFPSLPVGTYSVQVEMKGFRTVRRPGQTLEVGTPLTVDVALQVGETADVVTVHAEAEELQVSDASVGNVVTQHEIKEMPLTAAIPWRCSSWSPASCSFPRGRQGLASTSTGRGTCRRTRPSTGSTPTSPPSQTRPITSTG